MDETFQEDWLAALHASEPVSLLISDVAAISELLAMYQEADDALPHTLHFLICQLEDSVKQLATAGGMLEKAMLRRSKLENFKADAAE